MATNNDDGLFNSILIGMLLCFIIGICIYAANRRVTCEQLGGVYYQTKCLKIEKSPSIKNI